MGEMYVPDISRSQSGVVKFQYLFGRVKQTYRLRSPEKSGFPEDCAVCCIPERQFIHDKKFLSLVCGLQFSVAGGAQQFLFVLR
jgi:hypothetical protein